MRARVLISQPVPAHALAPLDRAGIAYDLNAVERVLSGDELAARLRGREGLLCLLTDRVDEELLSRCPLLRGIAVAAAGYDNADVRAAAQRGIPVSNTPGVLTETTADLAWALILSVARRIPEADRFTRAGRFMRWGMTLMLGGDVHGKTLGIVGAGRIGTAVAVRACGFGMRVLYCAPRPCPRLERGHGARRVELETLLAETDFVSLHVPLTPQTRRMIGGRELAMMKPSAYLVNTSRGAVVDEAALVRVLRQRRIAGAGLDVYEDEPRLAKGLAALENTVLLPHTWKREPRNANADGEDGGVEPRGDAHGEAAAELREPPRRRGIAVGPTVPRPPRPARRHQSPCPLQAALRRSGRKRTATETLRHAPPPASSARSQCSRRR